MCFIDGDSPSVFRQSVHRARKTHQCSDCRDEILQGERYRKSWGIWEGGHETFKTCARCVWDEWRIVQLELAEGCALGESYPPLGCIRDVLHERGMTPSHITYRKAAS